MDAIRKQVSMARRRLIAQQFLSVAAWSLFGALVVAAVGLAIPKIWVLAVDGAMWQWAWTGGALASGLVIALVWTYVVRTRPIDAAVELDRRFHLKERVSSALALGSDETDTEVARALVQDAMQRVERIDVRDRFPLRLNRRLLLPLIPAVAVFVLVAFVPNATPDGNTRGATSSTETNRVKKSAKELKKRLAQATQQAEAKGLKDANLLLKELQQQIDQLSKRSDLDRKRAMVKLNDLAKSLEERRKRLGGVDKMREQLNRLKNLQAGPADRIAQAMKEGDFQKALDELKNLQDKLAKGKLTPEEKKRLAEQLKQLRDKLQEMVDAHNRAKRDLEREIERRKAAGDLAGAGRLQRQLDKLNEMNDAMKRLQQMANGLGQCRQCLQNGDAKGAAAQMDELAQSLQDLQNQLDELETLDQVLDQIGACKEAMNCKLCNGEGCGECMGDLFAWNPNDGGEGRGRGMGRGRGRGERPEERTDTGFYDSQVRGKLRPGEAVRTGTAGGPNRAGRSRVEVQQEIHSNLSQEADPLIEVRLPRKQRQHTRQYFERFRKGT